MRIFPKTRSLRAFTLIEVMVAMAILAVIVAAIYASWTAILRSTKVGLEAAGNAQRERVTRRSIEEALGSVMMFQANLQHYAFLGDATSLSLVSHLPPTFPGSRIFGHQPVRRVTFRLEGGANSPGHLFMEQSMLLAPTNSGAGTYTNILATNVMTFLLEYWDASVNDFVTEWANTNDLPRIVKVSMAFGHGGSERKNAEVNTTVVGVYPTIVPREVQLPMGAGGPRVVRSGNLPPNQPGGGQPGQPVGGGQPGGVNPNLPPGFRPAR